MQVMRLILAGQLDPKIAELAALSPADRLAQPPPNEA